jgi:lipoprotein-releasing system ATP-binding protein
MIVVTHDPLIARQADRVVRLAEGRIEEWSLALA